MLAMNLICSEFGKKSSKSSSGAVLFYELSKETQAFFQRSDDYTHFISVFLSHFASAAVNQSQTKVMQLVLS